MPAIPISSRSESMRMIRSAPLSAWRAAKIYMALARAAGLSLGAVPSPISTQTMPASEARAFGNISGFGLGVKMNDDKEESSNPAFRLNHRCSKAKPGSRFFKPSRLSKHPRKRY